MCKKVNNKKCPNTRIDRCIHIMITNLNTLGVKTIASCCGHNKYDMTIVVRHNHLNLEICHCKIIPRSRNIYKRDKDGYYYIPEVSKEK